MDDIDNLLDGTTPVTGIDINSGTIDNAVIGATTPVAATVTTFTSTGIDDNATSTQLTITDTEATFEGDVRIGNRIIIPDGTVGLPSLRFSDDFDTGIYSRVANTINVTTGGVQRLEIDSAGNATFAGNIDASAGGIYLGGDTAANLLDDYEEGTWTPTFVSTNTGASGITTANNTYTKVGQLVTVRGYIVLTGGTATAVGDYLNASGLPFTPKAYGSSVSPYIGSLGVGSYPLTNRNNSGYARAFEGTTNFTLCVDALAAGSAIGTNQLLFTISYETTS